MRSIDDAFREIDRADFLPEGEKERQAMNTPIPIGFGQTNSQPTTVRLMLEWLDPQPGDTVLDVGSGSGWTAALLAYLTYPNGKVYAVERIPELVAFGKSNVRRSGAKNVRFFQAVDDIYGLPGHAPYDRILVSAAADELPTELLHQLKVGGTMAIPIKSSVYVIEKTSHEDCAGVEHPGFAFVPLLA